MILIYGQSRDNKNFSDRWATIKFTWAKGCARVLPLWRGVPSGQILKQREVLTVTGALTVIKVKNRFFLRFLDD